MSEQSQRRDPIVVETDQMDDFLAEKHDGVEAQPSDISMLPAVAAEAIREQHEAASEEAVAESGGKVSSIEGLEACEEMHDAGGGL